MDAHQLQPEIADDWLMNLANPMWSQLQLNSSHNTPVPPLYEDATNPLPDELPNAVPITRNNFNFQEIPPQSPNELGQIFQNIIPPVSLHTSPGPPDRRSFAGKYNFNVLINSVHAKKKYLYSAKLNRIYVDSCDFPLEFKWDDVPGTPRPAFVRATVVFSDKDQAERKVETCIQHKTMLEKSKAIKEPQLSNVLHSSRDEMSDGVYYSGGCDTWYSTLVKYENNPRSHAYKFVCKNSCAGGINRRPICIIFTFEDVNGCVHGRESVSVRVCACPRRDMRKDEEAEGVVSSSEKRECTPRRPDPASESRKAKKIKLEVVTESTTIEGDDRIVELPASIKVRGGQTAIAGFEVMIRMMEQHQRLSTDAKVIAEDAEMISHLRALIDSFKADT